MPINEYGRQKAAAEKEISALGGRAGIIRPTKVLTRTTPLINSWVKSLSGGKKISAWEDCYFSPISLNYAINAIALIAYAEQSGISHVSGSDDISYAHFAQMLAIKVCGSDDLVNPVS